MARHTLAVALINSGSSVYSVSRILGHNSTASVEKTYAHLLQEIAEVDLERCMKEAFEKRYNYYLCANSSPGSSSPRLKCW